MAAIDTVVSDIAASAKEQVTGPHQVNRMVNEMDQVTQQNAAMVEQSTAASHALGQETSKLATHIAKFKLGTPATARGHARATPPAELKRPRSAPALRARGGGGAAEAVRTRPDDEWTEF